MLFAGCLFSERVRGRIIRIFESQSEGFPGCPNSHICTSMSKEAAMSGHHDFHVILSRPSSGPCKAVCSKRDLGMFRSLGRDRGETRLVTERAATTPMDAHELGVQEPWCKIEVNVGVSAGPFRLVVNHNVVSFFAHYADAILPQQHIIASARFTKGGTTGPQVIGLKIAESSMVHRSKQL